MTVKCELYFHSWNRYILVFIISVSFPLTVNGAFENLSSQSYDFLINPYEHERKFGVSFLRSEMYGLPELAVNKIGIFGMGESTSWKVEFQSTGDEIYREQQLSVEGGYRTGNLSFMLISDLFFIYIKDYGSATAPGLGLKTDWRPNPDFTLSGGVDRLLTGGIRKGQRDIRRLNWSRIDWKIGGNSRFMLLLDKPEGRRAGFSLGYGQNIGKQLGMRLMLLDYPARVGGGIILKLGLMRINLAVIQVNPLGWSQQAGIGFIW
ncbi:hypothetical protein HQ587_11195 [bacterium]|nr:hypothetical protein [bacterium]